MKIAIVDDDPNAQKILKAVLQQAGHQAVLCAEESAALALATAEAPPAIYIIDWKNGGVNGASLCKRLREQVRGLRPYLFLLTTRQAKEDVAEGLDAGADAYLPKPFNLVELQARLRAAVRAIDHQLEVLQALKEASSATERSRLLGEMLTKQQGAKVPSTMQAAATAVTSVLQARKRRPAEFDQYEVRFISAATLLEFKLVLQSTKPCLVPTKIQHTDLCAWTAIHCPGIERWIDLLLACRREDAAILFQNSLGRSPANSIESQTFLAELAQVLGASFLRTLQRQDAGAYIPCPPKGLVGHLTRGEPPDTMDFNCHELCVDGVKVSLGIQAKECCRQEVSPSDLREQDLLAEALPPPSFSEVPLFKKGTLMSARFVERLHEQGELSAFPYSAFIHRPTQVTRFFLRN